MRMYTILLEEKGREDSRKYHITVMCYHQIFQSLVLRKKTHTKLHSRENPVGPGWVTGYFNMCVILPVCVFTGFCNRWKGRNRGALG